MRTSLNVTAASFPFARTINQPKMAQLHKRLLLKGEAFLEELYEPQEAPILVKLRDIFYTNL